MDYTTAMMRESQQSLQNSGG